MDNENAQDNSFASANEPDKPKNKLANTINNMMSGSLPVSAGNIWDIHLIEHRDNITLDLISNNKPLSKTSEEERQNIIIIDGFNLLKDTNHSRITLENQYPISNLDLRALIINESNFNNATFYQTQFNGSIIIDSQFKGATFENCDFTNADLTGVDFSNATFINCSFNNANLTDANLNNAVIDNSHFDGAVLDGATMKAASAYDCTFNTIENSDGSTNHASLKNVDWPKADIQNCQMIGADMRNLSWKNASCASIDLTDATTDNGQWQNIIITNLPNAGTANRPNGMPVIETQLPLTPTIDFGNRAIISNIDNLNASNLSETVWRMDARYPDNKPKPQGNGDITITGIIDASNLPHIVGAPPEIGFLGEPINKRTAFGKRNQNVTSVDFFDQTTADGDAKENSLIDIRALNVEGDTLPEDRILYYINVDNAANIFKNNLTIHQKAQSNTHEQDNSVNNTEFSNTPNGTLIRYMPYPPRADQSLSLGAEVSSQSVEPVSDYVNGELRSQDIQSNTQSYSLVLDHMKRFTERKVPFDSKNRLNDFAWRAGARAGFNNYGRNAVFRNPPPSEDLIVPFVQLDLGIQYDGLLTKNFINPYGGGLNFSPTIALNSHAKIYNGPYDVAVVGAALETRFNHGKGFLNNLKLEAGFSTRIWDNEPAPIDESQLTDFRGPLEENITGNLPLSSDLFKSPQNQAFEALNALESTQGPYHNGTAIFTISGIPGYGSITSEELLRGQYAGNQSIRNLVRSRLLESYGVNGNDANLANSGRLFAVLQDGTQILLNNPGEFGTFAINQTGDFIRFDRNENSRYYPHRNSFGIDPSIYPNFTLAGSYKFNLGPFAAELKGTYMHAINTIDLFRRTTTENFTIADYTERTSINLPDVEGASYIYYGSNGLTITTSDPKFFIRNLGAYTIDGNNLTREDFFPLVEGGGRESFVSEVTARQGLFQNQSFKLTLNLNIPSKKMEGR